MTPTIEQIQYFTAEAFNLPLHSMVSPMRNRLFARPRQVAMYLSRRLTKRSLPEIGRRFGGRDHTTVLHACRRIEALMLDDDQFQDTVNTLARRMGGSGSAGFNLLSLGDWLQLARTMRVPHIPAQLVAEVPVDDLRNFNAVGNPDRARRLRNFFGAVYAKTVRDHVLRWDHCASGDLKAYMARGWRAEPPQYMPTMDDPRAYDLLDDLPASQTMMTMWRRPWVPGRESGGWPVEYRVFVDRGQVVAISSYYPQRPLYRSLAVDYEMRLALTFARSMAGGMNRALVNPQIEAAGLPTDTLSCTMDFVATEKGVLFLEGGPPHTETWGAHACCFEGRAVQGISLSLGDEPEPLVSLGPAFAFKDERQIAHV